MFHLSRWKSAAVAGALALSSGLASQAFAAGKTVTAVMHADLRTPGMMTTAYIVRDFGYMIFDTLAAEDANFKIQPQMAEWKVSDDRVEAVNSGRIRVRRNPRMARIQQALQRRRSRSAPILLVVQSLPDFLTQCPAVSMEQVDGHDSARRDRTHK